MFSSDMSRNSGFLVSNPSSFIKHRDSMGSDLFLNQTQLQLQHQQQQQGGGLARFRSAPSSFLAALLDTTTDNSSSGDESEALLSALMDGPRDLNQKRSNGENLYQMKQEYPEPRPGPGTQMGYESGSYSVGMSSDGSGNSSNLVRQSSSPAGFFNGYGMMGVHNNHHSKGGSSLSSSSAAKNFSSSTSRFMPSIPENANDSNGQLGRASSANAREFEGVFPQESWTDTTFNSLKRSRDDDDAKIFPTFNGLENQNGETRKNHHGLVHHLSLPKTSSEMAEVEKFLQFQPETVPCQIRAKRGCATHPRSIAERIRRTRISEKMKKLQDLFPNMDKQTSTADMLDLAVQFIKDLQKQVDTLTETKARCVCLNKPQQVCPNS